MEENSDYRNYDEMIEELRNHNHLYQKFMTEGFFVVEVPGALEASIARLFKRNNRKALLRSKIHKNALRKYLYFAYLFWIDVVCGAFFDPDEKGFIVVKYFSEFFWHAIESYKAEDITDDIMRLTFYPRT